MGGGDGVVLSSTSVGGGEIDGEEIMIFVLSVLSLFSLDDEEEDNDDEIGTNSSSASSSSLLTTLLLSIVP